MIPEVELTICCAKIQYEITNRDRIDELIRGGINWRKLTSFSNAHGMSGLVYYGLIKSNNVDIPSGILSNLKEYIQNNTKRNIALFNEVLSIIEYFDKYGIKAIPFKGPVLAKLLHDDLSVRQIGDLDILVNPEDVELVSQLLQQNGFRTEKNISPDQWYAIFDLTNEYHINYLDGNKNYWLELHWNIASEDFIVGSEFELFWNRLKLKRVQDTQVLAFQNEDLLLALCVHGYKHAWYRMFWIWEFSELIRKTKYLDWEMIQSNADLLGIQKALLTGIKLAHDLFASEIPKQVMEKVAMEKDVDELLNVIKNHYSTGSNSTEPPFMIFLRFRLAIIKGAIKKVKWLVIFIITPNHRDVFGLRLKYSYRYLYYIYRPFRIIFFHGNVLLGRILRLVTPSKF